MTMSSSDEAAELLGQLVSLSSPSGEESAVQAFIADWFTRRGLTPVIEPAADGLVNVVVEIEGAGPGPALFLGGHSDTVAPAPGWSSDPLTPQIVDGRMYGLGAMDMKGGLACAMLATADLAACRADWSGKLVFASLADEEAHSRGANAFVRTGRRIDAAIMCEPHFDDVVIGAMGKFNIAVSVTGRSAHGSHPAKGINAVTAASRLIVALDGLERQAHERFGPANHCVLNVAGGLERYEIRVPDKASFLVNWHVMPGESSANAVTQIEALVAGLESPAGFDIAVREPRYESFWLGEEHEFVRAFSEVYAGELGVQPTLTFGKGVSDANIFNADGGIPTILFGPSGANMHAADEWVELTQLPKVRSVLRSFGLRFLRA